MFRRITSAISIGQTVNWSSPLNHGLVSWWLAIPQGPFFGGTRFLDLCGKNHGTLTNAPTWGGARGRPGGSGRLDFVSASTQYVATTYKQTQTTVTVAMWARHTGLAAARAHIININYNGSNVALNLQLDNTNLAAGIGFYNGAWRGSGIVTDVRGDGLWHFHAGTYDGSTLVYYLDGKQDSSSAYSGSLPTTNANGLDIGRYGGDSIYFTGSIDGVAIWPGRVMTATDISLLYEEARRGYPTTLNWHRPYRAIEQAGGAVTAFPWHYYQQMMAG